VIRGKKIFLFCLQTAHSMPECLYFVYDFILFINRVKKRN